MTHTLRRRLDPTELRRRTPMAVRAVPARIRDEQSLLTDMEVTTAEVTQRKTFLEFHEDDVERLTSINELANQYADPVIEDFYAHLLAFEETAVFFRDPAVL